MTKLKKKLKSITKIPTWVYFIIAFFIKCLVRCFYRVKVEDPNGCIPSEKSFAVLVWHNRIMFMPAVFPLAARKRTKAIVSASRDGQYLTDFLRQFNLGAIRGSSSRGGANVQRESVKAINNGWHVCSTPDGPRGPKYHMKRGSVHLASLTGHPVLPVSINSSRYWEFKSWDKCQIPKPFSTITVVLGDPIEVPPNLSKKEELEEWRQKAEDKLMEITRDKHQ